METQTTIDLETYEEICWEIYQINEKNLSKRKSEQNQNERGSLVEAFYSLGLQDINKLSKGNWDIIWLAVRNRWDIQFL